MFTPLACSTEFLRWLAGWERLALPSCFSGDVAEGVYFKFPIEICTGLKSPLRTF